MTRIYLETKHNKTPEYIFVDSYLNYLGLKDYEIICVNGWANLANVVNKLLETTIAGGRNIIIFDADTIKTGGGYAARISALKNTVKKMNCEAEIFLWPNNQADGVFENVLEHIARKDLYKEFFDCFGDYESCMKGRKNNDGYDFYTTPNLKGKMFTYVSSLPMSNTQRNNLGKGQWLFDNPDYWHLDAPYLQPLRKFLIENLQQQ